MKKLILSDVCDTLINLNSTYDYINFLRNHKYGNRLIGFLLNNYLFKLFSYVILRLTKYDTHRNLTFKYFKNIKVEVLKNINKQFWNFYISKRTKILDKIIEHKDKGDKVILVSASINPPIDMLGDYLGIDYFSSKLEERNGIYTGKAEKDLLGNKESLLIGNKLNILEYDKIIFYTDNLSDIGFISKIQGAAKKCHFFLIIKSEKMKNQRLRLLDSNGIKNYEFIS